MKYIIAVIQPHRLDAVREALGGLGVQGLTVSEVRGFGRQKGQTEIYRGAEYVMHYVPKVKLEIAVDDGIADSVVEAVGAAARTGRIGDGKVFVLDLEGAMRVRTGEMGADALLVALPWTSDAISTWSFRRAKGRSSFGSWSATSRSGSSNSCAISSSSEA